MIGLLALLGCTPGSKDVAIFVPIEHVTVLNDLVDGLPADRVLLQTAADPEAAAEDARGTRVAVTVDPSLCGECYRLSAPDKHTLVASGGGLLGVQYAMTAALEQLGVRFFHPAEARVPDRFGPIDLEDPALGDHAPEMARRGLHLHTLHPIEGLYDLWLGGDDGAGARRIVDWVVANRGNHLQWVALDDITDDPERHAAWVAHTAEVIAYAHAHGLTTGLGVQLFGASNLQQAFDLVDGDGSDPDSTRASIDARMRLVTEQTPFDLINLSFGEFFAAEPQAFVDSADLAYEVMQEVAPGIEVTTVIHVGNFDDLRVEYQGEELLYYFLVKYADPGMVPWVHTVMYYNLFEDAGLAYLHDEFDEHREFLLDRLRAGEPVGYFPESAYWVAFDIHVPTYLPLYLRSRFTDLDMLRQIAEDEGIPPLDDHVLFSSGWEWGYWQQDLATLRMNYELGASPRAHLDQMFATYGEPGARLAAVVDELADLQHAYLLEGRLAAYLAGREAVIDFGDGLGIVSQPDRPDLAEVAAYDAATAAAFHSEVLDPLTELAAQTRALRARASDPDLPDDRFIREIRDGLDIDALRADFAHAIFRSALEHGQGGDPAPWIDAAMAYLEIAHAVVDRRHADLHDPDGARLITEADNPTIYDYGYLLRGDELCFWTRELAQARNLALDAGLSVPPCAP